MGGFRKLQLDNTHFGESENRTEEEAPKPTQLVKAVLTHPFSILTGLPEAPYYFFSLLENPFLNAMCHTQMRI